VLDVFIIKIPGLDMLSPVAWNTRAQCANLEDVTGLEKQP
jgi:hypothetical protein